MQVPKDVCVSNFPLLRSMLRSSSIALSVPVFIRSAVITCASILSSTVQPEVITSPSIPVFESPMPLLVNFHTTFASSGSLLSIILKSRTEPSSLYRVYGQKPNELVIRLDCFNIMSCIFVRPVLRSSEAF